MFRLLDMNFQSSKFKLKNFVDSWEREMNPTSYSMPPKSCVICSTWQAHIQMAFLSWDSWVGVLKSRQLGFLRFWSPITLWADLGLQCGLKQSCSFRQELSNGMSHALCNQVNWVDSQLLLVGSQTGSLTPDLSFGHNLCFKCPNEQCKPILNIYILRAFQWYKERHNHWILTPEIALWNFGSPPRLHLPKWELPWECEGSLPHTPSHFLTLPGVCDVTPRLLLRPQLCNLFALVASPKLGLRHLEWNGLCFGNGIHHSK